LSGGDTLHAAGKVIAGLADSDSMTLAAECPRFKLRRLQRVLNAAARAVRNSRKFDPGLHNLMHIDLYWLDVPERVT